MIPKLSSSKEVKVPDVYGMEISKADWKLYRERVSDWQEHPGVLIELRKSTALWDIAYFVRDKVITMNELEGFSEDLIDAVKLILNR